MNYKVLNKNFSKLTSEEFLETILHQRGVEDVNHLLNVSEKDLCDAMKFKNIKEGLNLFDYWMGQDECHIHIIYDVDLDGDSSGTYMYNYIKKVNPSINVTTSMNEGKKHGIIIDYIPNIDTIDFLIVPDAGSSDYAECLALNDNGIDILILDHHDFEPIENLTIEESIIIENNHKKLIEKYNINNNEKKSGQTVVINNQDGSYDNKTLSGVGVCYKFCKEYDNGLGLNYADDDLDLVSAGMVADCSDLRNYETRFLVNKGLNNINNELVKEILYKTRVWNKEEPIKQVTIEDIGWKIAPQFNGAVREGTKEDKELMVKALIGDEQNFEYQPKRKKKKRMHIAVPFKIAKRMKCFKLDRKQKKKFNTRKKAYDLFIDPIPPKQIYSLQQEMARKMYNIKTRQTKKINTYIEQLDERVRNDLKDGDKIIVVDSTDIIEEKTYTGLVANKMADKYKRPCLVLRKNRNGFGGSARNYRLSEIEDLKEDLNSLNIFNKLAGHPNSFGIEICADKIEEMKAKFNETHKYMKIEDTYLCDFEILSSKLKYEDILEIAKLRLLWGGDLSEPQFILPNIIVKAEQITRHNNMKWNNIELQIANGKKIKVYQTINAGEIGYNKMLMRDNKNGFNKIPKTLKMDLIVKMKMWNFNNKEYPYLLLVDYNVTKGLKARF